MRVLWLMVLMVIVGASARAEEEDVFKVYVMEPQVKAKVISKADAASLARRLEGALQETEPFCYASDENGVFKSLNKV